MNYKKEIETHLKAYDKVELVDSYLVSRAIFCLEQMDICEKDIEKNGSIHVTEKTKYPTKSGRVAAYEGYLKAFITISKELGLSPQARRQWVKQIKEKKLPGDDLIK